MKSMKQFLVFIYLETQALKRKLGIYLRADKAWSSHLKPDITLSKKWLGTVYGGFYIHPKVLNADSVVLSIGIGKDISFDRALIKRKKCRVHGYDPTPKSIDWISGQRLPPGFTFHPFGITAGESGTYKFLLPENPRQVSGTIAENGPENRTIEVPLFNFSEMVKELGIASVDVLKMDIEGAEYEVLMNILSLNIPVGQILVEFHDRNYDHPRSREVVNKLREAGYLLFGSSLSAEEISFIHKSLLKI